MALVTSTSSQLNFGIKQTANQSRANRTAPAVTSKIIRQSVGNTGAAIPLTFILGDTIVISPSTVNQTYTLPSASQILSEFGKSIDTGVPKLAAGDCLQLKIVNRGAFAGYILTSPTGGDGSALLAYTGGAAASTGAIAISGKLTTMYLELTAVNGGVNGATGAYTIYM